MCTAPADIFTTNHMQSNRSHLFGKLITRIINSNQQSLNKSLETRLTFIASTRPHGHQFDINFGQRPIKIVHLLFSYIIAG